VDAAKKAKGGVRAEKERAGVVYEAWHGFSK